MEQNVRFEKVRLETPELYLNIHLNINHKLYTENVMEQRKCKGAKQRRETARRNSAANTMASYLTNNASHRNI